MTGAGDALVHHKQQVVGRGCKLGAGRGSGSDLVHIGLRHLYRAGHVEAEETLALGEGVRVEWGAHEADCQSAGQGGGNARGEGEGGAVCDVQRVDADGGLQIGHVRGQVGRGERFDAKLGGEWSRECVELVGVAACQQNPTVLQQYQWWG